MSTSSQQTSQDWMRSIADEVSAFLKPLGYKKTRFKWLRKGDKMIQQIWLRKSAMTSMRYLRFFAQISVGSLEITALEPPPPIWALKGPRFHWGQDLAWLLPDTYPKKEIRSKQWEVSSTEECAAVKDLLIKAVSEVALPAMEAVSTHQGMLEYLMYSSEVNPKDEYAKETARLAKIVAERFESS